MRNQNNAFHLAIPCKDLQETLDYYENKLGCESRRKYEDRVTFDFFGDQLVCHLYPEKVDLEANPYPRHFGVTFSEKDDFESFITHLKENGVDFLHPITTRFEGLPEVHSTFFLKDPSNNVLEFKFYPNKEMMH